MMMHLLAATPRHATPTDPFPICSAPAVFPCVQRAACSVQEQVPKGLREQEQEEEEEEDGKVRWAGCACRACCVCVSYRRLDEP